MMNKVLIVGVSSGLGSVLCDVFLENKYEVHGISPMNVSQDIRHCILDYGKKDAGKDTIPRFLADETFDYVILNTGVLGSALEATTQTIDELQLCFQINVGACKQVLDVLLAQGRVGAKNVIAISSPAANKTYTSMLSYCVTKAAFRQLISCYAAEYKNTHFLTVSPSSINENYKSEEIEEKFHTMYEDKYSMSIAVNKIFKGLDMFKELMSGSFYTLK
jgi:NAD(P)-dependent dehydrogenase (short-subunit alcohol dehydrogenase family)